MGVYFDHYVPTMTDSSYSMNHIVCSYMKWASCSICYRLQKGCLAQWSEMIQQSVATAANTDRAEGWSFKFCHFFCFLKFFLFFWLCCWNTHCLQKGFETRAADFEATTAYGNFWPSTLTSQTAPGKRRVKIRARLNQLGFKALSG